MIPDFIQQKLNDRKKNNRFRILPELSFAKEKDFCSNDYFSLAIQNHPLDFFLQKELPQGSGGSRLISGNHPILNEVEKQVEKMAASQNQKALYFSSGYMANLGLLSAIGQKQITLFFDADIHASLKDGIRLSHANRIRFKHNDLNHLEHLLKKSKAREKFVVIESVYSMDGSLAPLEITFLCEKYHAYLIVDEAHGFGVFGQKGAGRFANENVFARILTFGKAAGCSGACVVASDTVIDYCINFARSFIYTTAPSPLLSSILLYNLIQLEQHAETWQNHLNKKVRLFQKNLYGNVKNLSPILGFVIPTENKVKEVANILQEKGFGIIPIVAPTVKAGQERLRISLHLHNPDEVILSLSHFLKHLSHLDAVIEQKNMQYDSNR
ncbi:MAG: aminotransferase class I/II-fold pyridoxal phosphate-dependent enzyme [Candidatus Hydrogenedentota bacterium]|nr:MAG: aminotransferase class I/II-fold pyridoxal phosphate-dependent enzyme [Candidatus Hydrogenedentota bacterium]